jgi:hypothetical protein
MKKDEERNPTCSHYEKKGHDEKHCWKLHPKLKPKWAHPRKGKNKTGTIMQDLGSNFEDQTKVTTMGIKGKSTIAIFSLCIYSAKDNLILDGRQRKDIFHLRVISKHTKIDTLVDSV